jgi:hypothetical protein
VWIGRDEHFFAGADWQQVHFKTALIFQALGFSFWSSE